MILNKRVLCGILVVTGLLTSCSQEIPNDISDTQETTFELQLLQTTSEVQVYSPAEPKSGQQLPKSKADVLQMYKQAADLVKLRCPGFTRTSQIKLYDFQVQNAQGESGSGLLPGLVRNSENTDSVVTVKKDDDLSCRMYFPVYDTDYGCRLEDMSCVQSAVCYDAGDAYEMVVLFYEQPSALCFNGEFGQIMTPYSPQTLLERLQLYLPFLTQENFTPQLRYYNCELRCKIDKKSGHLLSLSQKMVTDVALEIKLDLVLTTADFTAKGILFNQLQFSDFIWH